MTVLLFTVACMSLLALSDASFKKGLGVMFAKDYNCRDEFMFNNVHWWYDWRQKPDIMHKFNNCNLTMRAGYAPMVRATVPRRDIPIHIYNNSRYLLGFNEPDHKDHANMTPAAAAAAWPLIEKAGAGKVLVSPSVTGINWLEQFFANCTGCKVDHVGFHIYICNPDAVMHRLKSVWNRFHKPIWLTEFACPHTNDANVQLNFMKALLPRLEAASYVFRYAWFTTRWASDGFVLPSASLIKPNSDEMTTLGHYYNNFMH